MPKQITDIYTAEPNITLYASVDKLFAFNEMYIICKTVYIRYMTDIKDTNTLPS